MTSKLLMPARLMGQDFRRPLTRAELEALPEKMPLLLAIIHAAPRTFPGQLWDRAAERTPSGRHYRRRAQTRLEAERGPSASGCPELSNGVLRPRRGQRAA